MKKVIFLILLAGYSTFYSQEHHQDTIVDTLFIFKDEYKPINITNDTIYDKQGNISKIIEFNHEIPIYKIYEYDLKNQLIIIKQYQQNSLNLTTSYKYDSIGNNIVKVTLNPINSYKEKVNYKHDNKGRVIKKTTFYTYSYNISEKLKHISTFEYDIENNITQQSTFDSKGLLINNDFYEYNHKNELTKNITIDYNNINCSWKTVSIFQNKQLLKIETFCLKNPESVKLKEAISYKYDENGNQIEKLIFDNNKNLYWKEIYVFY